MELPLLGTYEPVGSEPVGSGTLLVERSQTRSVFVSGRNFLWTILMNQAAMRSPPPDRARSSCFGRAPRRRHPARGSKQRTGSISGEWTDRFSIRVAGIMALPAKRKPLCVIRWEDDRCRSESSIKSLRWPVRGRAKPPKNLPALAGGVSNSILRWWLGGPASETPAYPYRSSST